MTTDILKPDSEYVTRDGRILIEDWENCVSALKSARSAECQAVNNLAAATRAIGKWMLPPDAKVGESFNIAHGTAYLQVDYVSVNTFEIRWRGNRRPRE
jgi:hypothetical protein